jgi:integrase
MKLNSRNVAGLVRPAGKDDVVIWDDNLPGFGVRLRGDNKGFLVQYRVGLQQRRENLGDVRKVKLEDARKAARQRFAQAQLGQDPAAERAEAKAKAAAKRLTLGVVAERYLESKKPRLRPTSYADARRYFTRHWASLRDRPIAAIQRAEVAAGLHDIIKRHGSISAARARANLSALFAWAMCEGFCEANPVLATNNPEKGYQSRTRVLAEAELAIIWKACADDDFGRIVKLLMLTGCRRGEIGELKWSEIDFAHGTITIAGNRTKNGHPLTLTLPPVALDLLRSTPRRDNSDNVFGGGGPGFTIWSHAVKGLHARIIAGEGKPLPPWTLHDIRRSAATHMAEIGVQPHIIEAVLNHVSGHKSGVAGIYNRAAYTREIAAALQLWSEHLLVVIAGRKRKVVPLRKPVPA